MVLWLLLPRLDSSMLDGAVRDFVEITDSMESAEVLHFVRDLGVADLPAAAILALVQRVLHSEPTRRDLLDRLVEILPALQRLGGDSVIQALPEAMNDAVACVH